MHFAVPWTTLSGTAAPLAHLNYASSFLPLRQCQTLVSSSLTSHYQAVLPITKMQIWILG